MDSTPIQRLNWVQGLSRSRILQSKWGTLSFTFQHTFKHDLFGPVSISQSYSRASKKLLLRFLKAQHFEHHLSQGICPSPPYRHPSVPIKKQFTQHLQWSQRNQQSNFWDWVGYQRCSCAGASIPSLRSSVPLLQRGLRLFKCIG